MVLTAALVAVVHSASVAAAEGGSAPGEKAGADQSAGGVEVTRAGNQSLESAEDWLGKIEARSRHTKTLHAKLRYDRVQGLVGDRQRRFGTLVYDAGPPSRFSVHFDYLLVDRRLDRQDRWYVFDGQWLVERYDQDKLFIKRQVVAPDTPDTPDSKGNGSEQADLLALGEGPFPVPVTTNKARILERFEVAVIEPAEDDPSNSLHLQLTPKPTHPSPFTRIDLWYDRATLLPARARTVDDSENESTIELSDLKVNDAVLPQLLDTSVPTEPGWRVEVKPWEGD